MHTPGPHVSTSYDSVGDARFSLGRYLAFYSSRKPHSSLDGVTPDQAFSPPLEGLSLVEALIEAELCSDSRDHFKLRGHCRNDRK